MKSIILLSLLSFSAAAADYNCTISRSYYDLLGNQKTDCTTNLNVGETSKNAADRECLAAMSYEISKKKNSVTITLADVWESKGGFLVTSKFSGIELDPEELPNKFILKVVSRNNLFLKRSMEGIEAKCEKN